MIFFSDTILDIFDKNHDRGTIHGQTRLEMRLRLHSFSVGKGEYHSINSIHLAAVYIHQVMDM